MVLHTLNAPAASEAFQDCLRLAAAGDTILLLGDGVYNALAGSEGARALQASAATVVVLAEDAAAAGLTDDGGAFDCIDMAGFVTLTETCPRQLAWY